MFSTSGCHRLGRSLSFSKSTFRRVSNLNCKTDLLPNVREKHSQYWLRCKFSIWMSIRLGHIYSISSLFNVFVAWQFVKSNMCILSILCPSEDTHVSHIF